MLTLFSSRRQVVTAPQTCDSNNSLTSEAADNVLNATGSLLFLLEILLLTISIKHSSRLTNQPDVSLHARCIEPDV